MSTIPKHELDAASQRYARVVERIERACERAGRDPSEIILVGACKRQPLNTVAAAVCAGVRELGENYVQGVQRLAEPLRETLADHYRAAGSQAEAPSVRWRMIGNLQRKKAKLADMPKLSTDAFRPPGGRQLDLF